VCARVPPPAPCLVVPQGVKDSPELRAAVEEVQPENVALGLRLSQSKPLYQAYKALRWGQGAPHSEVPGTTPYG